MNNPSCDRDENGVRIPREGTLSRRIYDLKKAGRKSVDVATELGVSSDSVNTLWWRMCNPQKANEAALKYNADARQRRQVAA